MSNLMKLSVIVGVFVFGLVCGVVSNAFTFQRGKHGEAGSTEPLKYVRDCKSSRPEKGARCYAELASHWAYQADYRAMHLEQHMENNVERLRRLSRTVGEIEHKFDHEVINRIKNIEKDLTWLRQKLAGGRVLSQ